MIEAYFDHKANFVAMCIYGISRIAAKDELAQHIDKPTIGNVLRSLFMLKQNDTFRNHVGGDLLCAGIMIGYSAFGVYSIYRIQRIDLFPIDITFISILSSLSVISIFGIFAKKSWWAISTTIFGLLLLVWAIASSDTYSWVFNIGLGLLIVAYGLSRISHVDDGLPSRSAKGAPLAAGITQETQAEAVAEGPEGKMEDFERLKYRLELEKFRWQKSMSRTDNNLFNKHFGVIITAVVSIAAVIVSLAQITISSNNSKTQIDNEKTRSDRRFYLEVARFLLTYEQDLRTQDLEKISYLRDVVISSFPPELARQVALTMIETGKPPRVRQLWVDGLATLEERERRNSLKVK